MTATVDITQDNILTALRAFLLDILPGGMEVVEGLVNRVPMVKAENFVVLTPGARRRLAWNTVTPGTGPLPDDAKTMQPTQVSVQVDVYGPAGAENAQIITTLFQGDYGCEFFAAQAHAIAPLYTAEPQKIPFVNAEKQFEDRWVIDAILQANPVTTTVQEYADTVTVGLIEVDTTYPPGA